MKQPAKATLEQLRLHNRRLVLRTLFSGSAATRAELAATTGLTKPTVSNLIAELIEEDLVTERGPGRSTDSGGKRPTLLEFEPNARQVIGLSLTGGRLLGVLSNLAGERSALHVLDVRDDDGAAIEEALIEVTASLVAQIDAPLACIGVGLPGFGERAPAQRLAREFGVNAYLGNQAELTALGQLAFAGAGMERENGRPLTRLVTLLIDERVEIGVCLASGAVHYGSDLSALVDWPEGRPLAGDELALLQLRLAARREDPAAVAIIADVAGALAAPLAWIVATLRPDEVSIGGRIGALGEPLLEALRRRGLAPASDPDAVRLSLTYSDQLGAMGAVALAVQTELGVLGPE